MKRQKLFFITIGLVIGLSLQSQSTIPFGNNNKAGNSIEVNGIQLYYEAYGEGQPLVILHGNGGSSGSRANILPELIKNYRVITVDHRCHGKSGCSPELNYQLMANDINELLNHLKIDSAYIYGHSDGGIMGLIMAMEYPSKVRKLVVSGANITKDSTALEPFIVEMMKQYKAIPDPMMQKQIKLMAEYPNMSFNSLRKISAPTLVIAGDRDAVRLSHTIKIFEHITNSNLSIWPGSTHFIGEENPARLLQELTDFLQNPFKKPSTVDWAKQVAAQIMPSAKQKNE